MKTHSSYHLPSLVPIIVAGNIFYFLRRYGIAMLAAAAFLVAIPLYAAERHRGNGLGGC